MTDAIIVGNISPRPRPTINFYYKEADGIIVGIASSRATMPEFDEYEVKELSWDEGSPFLNGERDMGAYFINVMSDRKELVKKNLVQIYGHDSNFDWFDLVDHGVMVDDYADADLNVFYERTDGEWKTSVHIISDILNHIYVTEYKKPLSLYSELSNGQYFSIESRASVYAHMDQYRTIKVIVQTQIHADVEITHVHD